MLNIEKSVGEDGIPSIKLDKRKVQHSRVQYCSRQSLHTYFSPSCCHIQGSLCVYEDGRECVFDRALTSSWLTKLGGGLRERTRRGGRGIKSAGKLR